MEVFKDLQEKYPSLNLAENWATYLEQCLQSLSDPKSSHNNLPCNEVPLALHTPGELVTGGSIQAKTITTSGNQTGVVTDPATQTVVKQYTDQSVQTTTFESREKELIDEDDHVVSELIYTNAVTQKQIFQYMYP